VLAAAGFACSAAKAGAAPMRDFARSPSPVQTDGSRYATWLRSDGASSVWDTATGRRFVLPPLAGCSSQLLIGGGHLVWNCIRQDKGGDIWVFNLARRTYSRVPGGGDIRSDEGLTPRFTGVGRNWLEGSMFRTRDYESVFIRLRDGVVVKEEATQATEVIDLDVLDDPLVHFCRRIRRPLNPDFDTYLSDERFVPLKYKRPFAVTQEGKSPGSLVIRSCLGGRPRLLARSTPIDAAQLGAGFVTWTVPPLAYRVGKAVAYVPRTHRRFSWPVSGSSGQLEVRHTANRIFVSQPRAGYSDWLLRSAPFNPR
jgi:hypothetical protein